MIPAGGRYSFDEPPAVGARVLSPQGRPYRVLEVHKANGICICRSINTAELEKLNNTVTLAFQANDLRYVPELNAKGN